MGLFRRKIAVKRLINVNDDKDDYDMIMMMMRKIFTLTDFQLYLFVLLGPRSVSGK